MSFKRLSKFDKKVPENIHFQIEIIFSIYINF